MTRPEPNVWTDRGTAARARPGQTRQSLAADSGTTLGQGRPDRHCPPARRALETRCRPRNTAAPPRNLPRPPLKPLGGVAGPVQFDPAHEQLRPGTREDREDALARQDGSLDRGLASGPGARD